MRKIYEITGRKFDLAIGDPSYFAEFSGEKLAEITFQEIYKKVQGYLVLARVSETYRGITYEFPRAQLILFHRNLKNEKNQPFIVVDGKGKILTDHQVKEWPAIDLGCDTAEFLINGEKVRTEGDGQYGHVQKLEFEGKTVADLITIDFPSHWEIDRIRQTFHIAFRDQRVSMKDISPKMGGLFS